MMDERALDTSLPTTYCVVGAGPFGLAAARALRRYGVDVEILERHSGVGGIWDIENPGSPMYESCHFITSKQHGCYIDFPMPDDYPDYPSWRQILAYVRSMAREFDLERLVRFDTEVAAARQIRTEAGTYWRVLTTSGEERDYRGIAYAGGQQWVPFLPDVDGIDSFTGRVIHSSEYRSPSEFAGHRVLVVGAGNSGVDIVVDAAQVGASAILSARRAYHFLPKKIFGVSTPDLFNGKEALPDLPVLSTLSPQEQLQLALETVGDLSRFGFPVPDAPIGSTQPIVNDLVLHCLSHGLLRSRPDLKRVDGATVEFVDGTSDEVDVIVFATGYDIDIPWLPDGLVSYDCGRPAFHLGTFAEGVEGLYAIGVLHPSVADAWGLFDQLAQLMAADAHATLTGENGENLQKIKNEYRPDLKGDFPFLDVRRNANQVDLGRVREMIDQVEKEYGIAMPRHDTPGFYDPLRVRPGAAGA